MTRIGVYVVIDQTAKSVLGSLLCFQNDNLAVRFFDDLARDPQGSVSRHVQEYKIVQVGEVSQESGQLFPLKRIREVYTGAKWMAAQPKPKVQQLSLQP